MRPWRVRFGVAGLFLSGVGFWLLHLREVELFDGMSRVFTGFGKLLRQDKRDWVRERERFANAMPRKDLWKELEPLRSGAAAKKGRGSRFFFQDCGRSGCKRAW